MSKPSAYLAKVVSDELFVSNVEHKRMDKEKSHVQKFHSEKSLETLQQAYLHRLRKKLSELPEDVHEQARQDYMRNRDIKLRACQQKQFEMIHIIEKMIRRKIVELGIDYRKYSVGGYDNGLFERMFKIQPKKYMSEAQFLLAMRNVFGFEMTPKAENQLCQLYKAFDYEDRNEVDWRGFLYLIALLVQGHEPLQTHLHLAFCIFSSIGTLDFDNRNRMKLSDIKDMIEIPMTLSSRAAVRTALDNSWFELTQIDSEASQVAFILLQSMPPHLTSSLPSLSMQRMRLLIKTISS
jgi:hypothetical protein